MNGSHTYIDKRSSNRSIALLTKCVTLQGAQVILHQIPYRLYICLFIHTNIILYLSTGRCTTVNLTVATQTLLLWRVYCYTRKVIKHVVDPIAAHNLQRIADLFH